MGSAFLILNCPHIKYTGHSQAKAPGTQNQLPEGFAQLLAPVRVDERVDQRVTDDEDEKKVEISKVTVAEGIGGAGKDEDQMEEEGTPA